MRLGWACFLGSGGICATGEILGSLKGNILSVVCLVFGVRNCVSGERAPERVLHLLLRVVNLAPVS